MTIQMRIVLSVRYVAFDDVSAGVTVIEGSSMADPLTIFAETVIVSHGTFFAVIHEDIIEQRASPNAERRFFAIERPCRFPDRYDMLKRWTAGDFPSLPKEAHG